MAIFDDNVLDISTLNGMIKVEGGSQNVFVVYNKNDFEKLKFTLDGIELRIKGDVHTVEFLKLEVNGEAPYDFQEAYELLSAIFNPCCPSSGVSGEFTSDDGQTITFVNGVITEITGGA